MQRARYRIILAAALVAAFLVLAGCGGSSAPSPPPSVPTAGTFDRAAWELRDKFDDKLIRVSERTLWSVAYQKRVSTLVVNLKEDGSVNKDSGNAFRQVYKDAGYAPQEMIVKFHDTRVDDSTGRASDHVTKFSIDRGRASRIHWANQDDINWFSYMELK